MKNEAGVVTEGGGPAAAPADEGNISSDVNWSDMALGMDDDGEGDFGGNVEGDAEVVEGSENPVESSPAKPATPPVTSAPAVQQEIPPAATQPPAQTPVPAPAPTSPPTPSQEPPVQPSTSYAEWREKQLEGLVKHYAFDDATSTQLLTEPEVVLPQLAAKLHMEVVEHVMRSVQTAVPQWIQAFNQTQTVEKSAEEAFFSANPDLKDPAYKNAILQMGMAYRQMNPNAPASEAVKVIGNMVRSAMGLNPTIPPQQVTQPAAQAQAPVFIPARGGGGGAVPQPVTNNPWAVLAEEFLTE